MSHNCQSAICHNVAWLGNISFLTEAKQAADEEYAGPFAPLAPMKLEKGWRDVGEKRGGKILGNILEKTIKYKSGKTKNLRLYLSNTSQYSHVGEYEWTIFGKNRKAVERFLRDFGLDKQNLPGCAFKAKVKGQDAVQSWY